MTRLISISNFARGDVMPAYRPDQIEAMLGGDFTGDISPTYVDSRTGESLEPDELRRRLATANRARPVFASADTEKIARAIAAHRKAQALLGAKASADQPNRIRPADGELVDGGVFKLRRS